MVLLAGLCFTGLTAAHSQSAPPAPPKGIRTFPRSTARRPTPRVIRLAPGQTRVTAAQLKSAPTVDQANRRGQGKKEKPLLPPQLSIPGAPRIIRDTGMTPPANSKALKQLGKPVVKPKSTKGAGSPTKR
jgi:hypothetical protein